MTAVREISAAESEALWIEGTFSGMTSEEEDRRRLFQEYEEEGHLVVLLMFEDHPTEQKWFAFCRCGENAWEMTPAEALAVWEAGSDTARSQPHLLTFGQAVWWHRDHRAEEGLEKQELAPAVTVEEMLAWLDGFHPSEDG